MALDRNIQSIIELSGNKKIRIASKSLRSVPVMRKILAANYRFQGIMCFSPREALFLIEQGFNDLLLGYPAYDERALHEISLLTKQGLIITCMVDCEDHIVYLEKIAEKSKGCFRVCLDIDMVVIFSISFWGQKITSKRCAKCFENSEKGKRIIIFNTRWCNGI